MEDNLQKFKMEYLSNHWLNITQMWNKAQEIKPKLIFFAMKTNSHWIFLNLKLKPDLKILKLKHLSNLLLDLPQLLNLSLGDRTKTENCCKWIGPRMEDNLQKF